MSGGVEQFVIGLATGLRQLDGADEDYLFLTKAGNDAWLAPFLGGRCRSISARVTGPSSTLRRVVRTVPGLRNARHRFRHHLESARIPESDGTAEREDASVVHLTKQSGFRTSIPTIYHPHDLQHLHLPHLFSAKVRQDREVIYRGLCELARFVAVASTWTKRDVIECYGLPPEKVRVIPLAPPVEAYDRPSDAMCQAVRERHGLPETFALYPAQSWPHKNHLALLEAVALLRQRDRVRVPLVFTGFRTDHATVIQHRIRELGLVEDVLWLGFVDPKELAALYRLCRCVVIPTLFEAGSFPMFEAFVLRAPVACSNVTSLPAQAGDAALIFDPHRPDDLAHALGRIWGDADLRAELTERGLERVAQFTWMRTARLFRAHYRWIAGVLTDEDRDLLAERPAM
jgi:glycosyltransferase involved in cell wall biosynthesis